MRAIALALRLEGEAVELDGGRYWVETRAHRGGDSCHGVDTAAVICRRQLELWDDGSLVQTGELTFGADDAVTFRARGRLGASPDPRRRHGTAVFEVTGGRGRFTRARGYVTSNFLLADTGELTDHDVALLFVEEQS